MIYYLIIINILSFILCYIDKKNSISDKTRISEKNLILVSMFGGCFSFYFGMLLFHHKTKKFKFNFLELLFIIIWIYIILKIKRN